MPWTLVLEFIRKHALLIGIAVASAALLTYVYNSGRKSMKAELLKVEVSLEQCRSSFYSCNKENKEANDSISKLKAALKQQADEFQSIIDGMDASAQKLKEDHERIMRSRESNWARRLSELRADNDRLRNAMNEMTVFEACDAAVREIAHD